MIVPPPSGEDRAVRSGRLTWAQQEWLKWVPLDAPTSHEDNICSVVPGHDTTVEQATAAVRDVLLRHEGLRTVIEQTDGVSTALQHVSPIDAEPAGTIRVADEDPYADPAGPVFDAALRTSFALSSRWPIRAVLFTGGEVVRHVALILDHAAVDAWGMRVLLEDFSRALQARAKDCEPFDPEDEHDAVEQPLDAAAAEASPAGLVYQQRALELWRRQLQRLHDSLDGYVPLSAPESRVRDTSDPQTARRNHVCELTSRRAAKAAEKVAETTGIPASTAFLVAFGAAICAAEGSSYAGIFPFAANRFTDGARRSVRKSFLPTMPVVVPRFGHVAYRDAMVDCGKQQQRGWLFANADPFATERLCGEVLREFDRTGAAYARFNYIDDSVVGSESDGQPLRRGLLKPYDPDHEGHIDFSPPQQQGSDYYLAVRHSASCAWITLAWHEYTGWGPHATSMLWYIENLLVWAAAGYVDAPPTF